MIYWIFIIIVALEAIEDGLWERGHKKWSKRSEGVYKVLLLLLPCLFTVDFLRIHTFWEKANYIFVIAVLWASIRAFLFDPIMHLISGYDQDHVGITSPVWDKIMTRLSDWRVWIFRGAFIAFSIFWYYKAVKGF